MAEKLELVLHEASERKEKGEDPKKIFEELAGKIEDIISEAFFATKQPVDPNMLKQNKDRLAALLGTN